MEHEPHPVFPLTTVGGLLRDAAGNILLVRTWKWSNLWGIPSGKVEYGETLEVAFLRETMEETGLSALNPKMVMVQDAIESPEFHRPAHFVLVNYLANVAGTKPHVVLNDEGQEYVWLPLQEALKMPLNGPTRILVEKVIAGGEPLWTC